MDRDRIGRHEGVADRGVDNPGRQLGCLLRMTSFGDYSNSLTVRQNKLSNSLLVQQSTVWLLG